MKATINGFSVEGTPDEIGMLIRQFGTTLNGSQPLQTTTPTPAYVPYQSNPIVTTPTQPNLITKPYGGNGLMNGANS